MRTLRVGAHPGTGSSSQSWASTSRQATAVVLAGLSESPSLRHALGPFGAMRDSHGTASTRAFAAGSRWARGDLPTAHWSDNQRSCWPSGPPAAIVTPQRTERKPWIQLSATGCGRWPCGRRRTSPLMPPDGVDRGAGVGRPAARVGPSGGAEMPDIDVERGRCSVEQVGLRRDADSAVEEHRSRQRF